MAKFNPAKEEIQSAVMEVEGLTISGIDDVAGYEAVKAGKKKLADYRIEITKFGKAQREEALKWQREVLRQEKELLLMIEPTETKLKNTLEAIDKEKEKQERIILLPSRKLMLDEIHVEMTDDEILNLDEEQFSALYTSKKMAYLESQEALRKEEEARKAREAELEQAKAEAAKKATEEAERKAKEDLERVEKEKQAEIEKIKRDQEEAEAKRIKAEENRLAGEAQVEREKVLEQQKTEKNQKYQAWLKRNNVTDENREDFHIKREDIEREDGSEKMTNFTLYRKVDSIQV